MHEHKHTDTCLFLSSTFVILECSTFIDNFCFIHRESNHVWVRPQISVAMATSKPTKGLPASANGRLIVLFGEGGHFQKVLVQVRFLSVPQMPLLQSK